MRPHKGITAQPHSPMLEQAAPHAMRPAVSSSLLPSLARRSLSQRHSRPSCQGGLHSLHARAAYKDHCNRANGLCAAHPAQARCRMSQKAYRAPPRPARAVVPPRPWGMGSSWTVAGRHAWAGAVASVQQATASKPGLAASRAAPQQGGPRLPRRGRGGSQLAAHDGGKVAAVHAADLGRVRRRLRQRRAALRGRAAERLGGRAVEVPAVWQHTLPARVHVSQCMR
jgi:hypothetical protein